MSKQERMSSIQLSDAVKNLQKLEGQQAASFSRQVAEASETFADYKPKRDVKYWRQKLGKDLAPRAAIDSVDKPLAVRE